MTLRKAIAVLTEAGVPNAVSDARILLSEICKIPSSKAILMTDEDVESAKFEEAIRRRAKREPLQYILGKWWFCGLEFIVSPSCLIPRAETELLVETAQSKLTDGTKLLDLCTGSGCVAVSVLSAVKGCTAVAVDISKPALDIAYKNAKLNKVDNRCTFICADVCSAVPSELAGKYDVITANPPYIRESEMSSLEAELSFEPRIALTDGGNGMRIVDGILKNYPPLLADGGIIAIEIGAGEGAEALACAEKHNLCGSIIKDYAGKDRILLCEYR